MKSSNLAVGQQSQATGNVPQNHDLWNDLSERFDQVSEQLTILHQSHTNWIGPEGSSIKADLEHFFQGPANQSVSADGTILYASSENSSWLIGHRIDRRSGQIREFTRLKLGMPIGGITNIAAGGVWVFVAGATAKRLIVLRLCHDWYQDRTRLLVMRLMDLMDEPTSLATQQDGDLVAILFGKLREVHFYRCRMNGRLEFCGSTSVPSGTESIKLSASEGELEFSGSFGTGKQKLESIFQKFCSIATVPE